MHHAQPSWVNRQSSERPLLKKIVGPLLAISMALATFSFESLAQASDRTTILNYICTTFRSARQVALEQSWETSKTMPGDCRTLFQQPFELRVAEILQVIEVIAIGDGRWTEIGRVRRSSIETGYSAGIAEDPLLF